MILSRPKIDRRRILLDFNHASCSRKGDGVLVVAVYTWKWDAELLCYFYNGSNAVNEDKEAVVLCILEVEMLRLWLEHLTQRHIVIREWRWMFQRREGRRGVRQATRLLQATR